MLGIGIDWAEDADQVAFGLTAFAAPPTSTAIPTKRVQERPDAGPPFSWKSGPFSSLHLMVRCLLKLASVRV